MPAIPPPQALTLDDETLARFVEASAALSGSRSRRNGAPG